MGQAALRNIGAITGALVRSATNWCTPLRLATSWVTGEQMRLLLTKESPLRANFRSLRLQRIPILGIVLVAVGCFSRSRPCSFFSGRRMFYEGGAKRIDVMSAWHQDGAFWLCFCFCGIPLRLFFAKVSQEQWLYIIAGARGPWPFAYLGQSRASVTQD